MNVHEGVETELHTLLTSVLGGLVQRVLEVCVSMNIHNIIVI
jgi:hypothetical protein